MACSGADSCEQISSRVVDYYTVPDDPAQMKASLYNDGPSYWRFDVRSDFSDGYGGGFWYDADPGDVYKYLDKYNNLCYVMCPYSIIFSSKIQL